MKQILFATVTIFFFLLLSCDNFLTSKEKEIVYLEYLGKSTENNQLVEFKLVNNSTDIIEYWGYGTTSPFYSSQIKNDTGWTWFGGPWCGTGLIVNELSENASIGFRAYQPDSLCTWRILLNYSIKGREEREIAYCEPIQIKP